MKDPRIHTYSIVVYDHKDKIWGVAVASKFLAVGAIVPYAVAGVGAVATQSDANVSFGPRGLALLKQGKNSQEVLDELLKDDTNVEGRQVGIVDAQGNAVTYTGKNCMKWAGGVTGKGYVIQGNILVGEQIVTEMQKAYENTSGDLVHRLYAALEAGDKTGGDKRGKQSACLIVVKEKGSYGGYTDRYLDLRVDDHRTPVQELGNLLKLYDLYLGSTHEDDKIKIDEALIKELQRALHAQGQYGGEINGTWDDVTKQTFDTFIRIENLEDRVDVERALIDPPALEFLQERFFVKS